MKNLIKATLMLLWTVNCFGQYFEGTITYKLEALNPNPQMIPDSTWREGIKQRFGDTGHMIQKYFYKEGKYISEITAGTEQGYQAFNPKDGILYSWQQGSDTAVTIDAKQHLDALVNITDGEKTEVVLGIPCKTIVLESKAGQMTIWYNSEHFKMDPTLFRGHKYGHWEQILRKTRCLPLKIEQKGFMTHIVQTAISFEETLLDDELFDIPKFKILNKCF
jgi:hypothetical protein